MLTDDPGVAQSYSTRGPVMLFGAMFGRDTPDPATNLAKTPALSKASSDDFYAHLWEGNPWWHDLL
jgi:hypothetical protein